MAESQAKTPDTLPTADDFLKDEKWRKRINNMFDVLDSNNNGFVPFMFFENLINKHEKALEPEPEVAVRVRKVLYEYAIAIGFYPSCYQVKEEFARNFAVFIEKDVARVSRGEESILVKRNAVMFELVSKKENEMITREESLKLSRAGGQPDSYTHDLYDQLDKEKTGKLDKKELSKLTLKLWSTLEHATPEDSNKHADLHDIIKIK